MAKTRARQKPCFLYVETREYIALLGAGKRNIRALSEHRKSDNVNVFCADLGFLFIFGAGDKFRLFRAGEEEERKRDGECEKFCRRGGKPKPRHLPQI